VPTQLVHAVPVTLEDVLLGQLVGLETEYADCLVVAATGQPLPVTAPVDAVNLRAVGGHFPGLVVPLEPSLELLHFRTDHDVV